MPTKKILAVIGDPISHSLSPAMQNAALRRLRLPFEYIPLRVRPKQLKHFVKNQARQLAGFNVTLPHKEAILPYLDRVSPDAQMIGAVNTVLNRGGELTGFNTDGAGYLRSLIAEKKFSLKGKRLVILGAGGAARAIAATLALAGAKKIIIANRTHEKAKQLSKDLRKQIRDTHFIATSLNGKIFFDALKECRLLINTTRVGLNGTSFPNFPWHLLKRGSLVSDIVYHPRMTPFLKQAKANGHPIHTGEGMLIHQGALAFQLWTGKKPNVGLMRQVLRKSLKSDEQLSKTHLKEPSKKN